MSGELLKKAPLSLCLYFVGIGGNGMFPLACLAQSLGCSVLGSDSHENENVLRLRKRGIAVTVGESALPPETDVLVRSLAVPETHVSCLEAVKKAVPIFTRAELLGVLERHFPTRIAVAGSHGKSSTVGMCAEILGAAGLAPTVLVGAPLSEEEGGYRRGDGNILLYEACEYGNSFLAFSPTHAAVLNAEWEHTDFFKSENDVLTSFRRFLEKTSVCYRLKGENVTLCADADFGKNGLFHAESRIAQNGRYAFSLYRGNTNLGAVKLNVIGAYQVENALAASALALTVGADFYAVKKGLSRFLGVGARMQYRGKLGQSSLYLDYAHHPTELRETISAAKQLAQKVVFVFEPHTYSRMFAFEKEYTALLAGETCGVLPIYAAREENIYGVSAERLAQKSGAAFLDGFESAAAYLAGHADADTVLLLIGAGNVSQTLHYIPCLKA